MDDFEVDSTMDDFETPTGEEEPSTVTGAYHDREDIESYYGADNVAIWADLDNDQDATKIANRIQTVITRTESFVNSRLRRSRYTIPFSGTIPEEIIEVCSLLSGARLYEPRSNDDFTGDAAQALRMLVSVKQRRAESILRDIITGKLVLDTSDDDPHIEIVKEKQITTLESIGEVDATLGILQLSPDGNYGVTRLVADLTDGLE